MHCKFNHRKMDKYMHAMNFECAVYMTVKNIFLQNEKHHNFWIGQNTGNTKRSSRKAARTEAQDCCTIRMWWLVCVEFFPPLLDCISAGLFKYTALPLQSLKCFIGSSRSTCSSCLSLYMRKNKDKTRSPWFCFSKQ